MIVRLAGIKQAPRPCDLTKISLEDAMAHFWCEQWHLYLVVSKADEGPAHRLACEHGLARTLVLPVEMLGTDTWALTDGKNTYWSPGA